MKGDLYCSWCLFPSAYRKTVAIANQKAALNQLPAWNTSSKESPKKSANTAKLLPSLNVLIYHLPQVITCLRAISSKEDLSGSDLPVRLAAF